MDATRSNIAHLFRRAGFGARPDELDLAVARGYPATVDALLHGLQGADPAGDLVPVPTFSTPYAAPGQTPTDPAAKMAANQQRRQVQNQQYQALQQWWLDRMIATSTPLREKLTLLWHNHFATGFVKVRNAGFMYRQNQLMRTMGGGNFEALTQAMAKDAAMMYWLDTETNVAGHPNENFARELMELFTLGIGNYTEADVQQGARAFTGWSLVPQTGDFVFRSSRHDNGVKSFLGQSGNFDGTDVVRIVTHQPASSQWVVAKLWSHLAYPVATNDPIVSQLAAGFARDLDITGLLRAIFLHPEFVGPTARAGLVKMPIEYLVGICRSFGLNAKLQPSGSPSSAPAPAPAPVPVPAKRVAAAALDLRNILVRLAQEPFNPPSVGGWPQNEYWLNTATSLTRLQFGAALASRLDLAW
ncbi:MAG: DUF1800 domain-containing protein, partial [Actinomycetota bacterium]|nr:DUF1800 domain-containing protein [Actinomycetota bacterium]